MKQIFTKLVKLFLLFFLPTIAFAQQTPDFNIMLNSGKFVPEENVKQLSKNANVFTKSLFNGTHYVAIQFNVLPDEKLKATLKSVNINLIDYLPNLAYTATIPASVDITTLKNYNIRSVFQLTSSQKTTQDVLGKKVPPHAIKQKGYADVSIQLYENLSADKIMASLKSLQAILIADVTVFKMVDIRIPQSNLDKLVALPFIQWVEYIAAPNVPDNLPGRTLHRVNIISDGVRNLKGDGMNIGVFDERASQHLDFSPAGRMINVDAGAAGSHGTHVSGTIGGRGIINPTARGMAPNATIYSYYGFAGDVQATMAIEIPAKTLISSNHSYHDGLGVQCGVTGTSVAYSLRARNTDINLNNNLYHLHCHSAGNAQTSCASGWGTITGTGKAAKNNLVVANITTTEGISGSSSFGPVHDGRVKPEISAMGTNVFSTYTPQNTYGTISGTSMSTPGITGTVALLAQRYKQLNANALPPSMLIKNIACNTAIDLGNVGPDYRFGFGRINALAAVKILETNRYALNTIANGAANDVSLTVPAGAARLNVMLTWNDPAAATNSAIALVNNLDLTVINGATTSLPWILDKNNPSLPATKAIDNISNIEQVTIDNPPAGNYTLRVRGAAITTGPNQPYALTWNVDMPYIEVTYPNGNESFNPTSSETITWDNAGVTGNQTVEYSLNNGASWTTLSTTVPAATTRLAWTVPTANTGTALVRVSSGSITDVSDVNFKILGTVTGFSFVAAGGCGSGQVSFTWAAVTNATAYDIYRLDPATGNFVLQSANVTGTAHTATGMTPGASLWFYIVAKNATTGTESVRSNAINATVSSGGGGLGVIGGITGLTAVCGAPTSVQYTTAAVTGATTYTWTVPTGATIVSGQGTTTLTVSFPAGSISGNVSVFAGNGTCQTSTTTLAITIGSSAIPQPLSGGNQSQTVCPGNPMPTLVASASVVAGNTLVWYNAAVGGTIVISPNLNTAGTVSYYAASRNTATGCESINRTMVTLSITQVAASTVSASSATTFCQGGSVILTANNAASYLWSNGATTPSITVSTNGTYSVTGTTGSCTSNPTPVVVTVNPLPAANITASGATTFCQGLNVTLTASAGSSWLWSNGATTQSITTTTTGNFSVTVNSAAGCSNSSSTTSVTVNPNPAAIVSANGPTTFCQGGNVNLTANSGASYLWSNGATTQTISVPASGTFSVAVTQAGGCVSNSSNTAVTVNPLPIAAITAAGPTSFCQGSNVVLTASAGSNWLWSNGATTQSISPSMAGNYSVTVNSAAGCSASSTSMAVSVSPNPTVSLSASPYTSLFPGLTTTLSASVTPSGNYIYTWYKNGVLVSGANSTTITGINLDKLGSYSVNVTNATGLPCSKTSSLVAITDSVTTKMFIYPSPNNGQFKVAYYTPTSNPKNTLVIYDSKGAKVYTKQYAITSAYQIMDVDMRKNGKGIYQVVLLDANGKVVANGSVSIM